MKKIFTLLGMLFLYHQETLAVCSYTGDTQKINFPLPAKILSDPSLPTGTVLAVKKVGGNVGQMKRFSNCSANDIYSISASPATQEVPGVKGVQGGPVYETGIKGIGFQISDAISGTNLRPTIATFGSVPAQGLSSGNVEQITVWLIKTGEDIDTSKNQKTASISYRAGPANHINSNDNLMLQINLSVGPLSYRATSCNVTPRTGGTVTLSTIQASHLRSLQTGAGTGKQKDIALDINCPDSSVGTKYIYWFNPITPNSSTAHGVLMNRIDVAAGGAKDVGFILRMNNNPIKFYDYTAYKFDKIKQHEEINLTADYYKLSNNITQGEVEAIFEVVLQEE